MTHELAEIALMSRKPARPRKRKSENHMRSDKERVDSLSAGW